MARKALVTALCISALLLVSTPSLANFWGPGFGLNGLASGWGPLSVRACGPVGPVCGSGVLSTGLPPIGCGTIPSCAIAGQSYAGSPGVFCSGFPSFSAGVPVPIPAPYAIPVASPVCVPPVASTCAAPAPLAAC